jgi:secondary thiamine-phosphate synthase enzyme
MRQVQHTLAVTAPARGLHEITDAVCAWVDAQSVGTGLLTLYIRHTSASLVIQENADPQVQRDLEAFMDRLVPDGDALYRHTAEGPDDMPAHVKGALTQTQLQIPVTSSALALGTLQGVFLFEHRSRPRPREIVLHLAGE